MRDIALLLDSLALISPLPKSSLLDRRLYVQTTNAPYSQLTNLSDANTIGSIAGVGELFVSFWSVSTGFMTLISFLMPSASIDWGCAVQVAAAVNIGNQNFVATQAQTLYVSISINPGLLRVCLSSVFRLADNYAVGSMWQ